MAANKGLGKGLNSLFDINTEESSVTEVMLSEIEPNRDQPRKDFDEKALAELADSIKKHGLLQPILVRSKPMGGYEIIAGERRWRASRMAGLRTVPVVIREMDEREAAEVALIENLQREDLNPVEEAMGYNSLMVSYGLTQEQVAEAMGKSRSAVANTLRLLDLTPSETETLKTGK
ncbi:MAG: ParB/RepB/Spo0J family partition protein, partial [Acutalibacteraceae bacterium]|nr:ParB/RepB/Spo0J family partition protein [Acutalibacteraceae bacterium]